MELLLTLLTLAGSTSFAQTSPAQGSLDLFTPVPIPEISRVHENELAIRQRNVFMEASLMESQEENGIETIVNFNLFEDVTIMATLEGIELAYADARIYNFSTGPGYWNYASVVVINESASGVVRHEGKIYTINTAVPGEFTVAEVDELVGDPCGVNSSHNVFDPNPQPKKNSNNRSHNRHVAHSLVVFTTDTVTAEGGIDGANTLANLSVSEMNRSLANGDSEFRVNLVHTYEDTTYVQSGNQGDDLSRFRDTSDGHLDAVHGFRDAYGADYCVLFIANYGTGIAYVNCSDSVGFESSAFSVDKNTRAAATFTFAHEIGHNMGLQHNHSGSGAATTCSDRDYCFGYRTTNYTSVMSYGPGTRLPAYSNPSINDPDGEALGTSALEDSSRHIGEWKDNFISYRDGVSIYHQVQTTFDAGNGSGGNMFDIKPKTDISITGISINTRIAAGTMADADIWYREGTHIGFEGSSTGWTRLGGGSGASAGEDSPTFIDLPFTVEDKVFEADKTYGIYIEATNGLNGDFRYTNGYETYEDSYLRIESGSGHTYGGFGSGFFNDRIWNGILHYDGAYGEHYLSTRMDGTTATFTGNMFDIDVHEDIVISSFNVNVNTAAGECAGVDIWYKSGSYVGSENEPMDWTFLGTDHKAVSAGPGVYTTISISTPTLSAGNTYGFYVRSSNGDTVNYTSGSETFSNTDMTLTTGIGLGGTNPFGTVASPRTWNGQLQYRCADDTPHLTVSEVVAGAYYNIDVTNASPGGNVIVAYSLKGGGPTSSPYGTVYLTRPWTQMPTMTADANGEAGRGGTAPATSTGLQVWLHGLDVASGTLTNPTSIIVQ